MERKRGEQTETPREELAVRIDGGRVRRATRDVGHVVARELLDEPRHPERLPVAVSQLAFASEAPAVYIYE